MRKLEEHEETEQNEEPQEQPLDPAELRLAYSNARDQLECFGLRGWELISAEVKRLRDEAYRSLATPAATRRADGSASPEDVARYQATIAIAEWMIGLPDSTRELLRELDDKLRQSEPEQQEE